MKLSIVMPVYNERQYIREIVQKVLTTRIGFPIEKELIIVDDCSNDGTKEILRNEIGDSYHHIKVFYHERNLGKGAALRTGFQHATGDISVIQDADLEYDPADWHEMLKLILEDKADIVFGSRFHGRSHRPLYWRQFLGNKLITTCINMLCDISISDPEVCYKMFRSEILKELNLVSNDFGFEIEFTVKVAKMKKWRIYETPISYYGRSYAEGKKINFKDGLKALWYILKFRL